MLSKEQHQLKTQCLFGKNPMIPTTQNKVQKSTLNVLPEGSKSLANAKMQMYGYGGMGGYGPYSGGYGYGGMGGYGMMGGYG